jgi:hypothetical protein
MLDARPNDPTMTTSFGFEISTSGGKLVLSFEHIRGHIPAVLKKRSIASKKIEKHNASKKTPLIKAARISARCHP